MKHFPFFSGSNTTCRIIRKSILILTIVLISFDTIIAQCDLDRSKDDFSKSQSVSSKDVKIASVFPILGSKKPWDLLMNFSLKDTSIMISVTHASQLYSNSISSISFLFKDGSIIIKETPFTAGDYDSGFGYKYTFTIFELTKEELKIFASSELEKFKSVFQYFPDYPVVEEFIKSKIASKIIEDAACILSEIKVGDVEKKDLNSNDKNECKYEKNGIDDFTKKRIVLTKSEYVLNANTPGFGSSFLEVSGSHQKEANGLLFSLGLIYTGSGSINIERISAKLHFNQLEILLENGDVINLKSNEISKYSSIGNKYYDSIIFSIKEISEWEKLKSSSLKKVRISLDGAEISTTDVEKKYANSIIKVIGCIDNLEIGK